jgi:hypothetical protein
MPMRDSTSSWRAGSSGRVRTQLRDARTHMLHACRAPYIVARSKSPGVIFTSIIPCILSS